MKLSVLFAVTATAVLLGTPAMAACELSQFNASAVGQGYDPFAESVNPTLVRLLVQTNNSKDCNGARVQLALTYAPGFAQSGSQIALKFGGSSLQGQITNTGGQAYAITTPGAAFASNPNSFALNRGGLLGGGNAFQFGVVAGQPVAPGQYHTELMLLARVTDAAGKTSDFSTTLPITVSVAPSVRLAAGGSTSLDLGELTSGATGGPVRFDAYSNVDYDLRIHSDNNFALAHRASNAAGDSVPYQPIVSGNAVDGGAKTREMFFNAPSGGLQHHTLNVKILPFSGARAGDYLDQITMEIRARI